MIYVNDNFPYGKYKGKGNLFETYLKDKYSDEDDYNAEIELQIDYSKELNLYRITKFKDNHWAGDIIFEGCR